MNPAETRAGTFRIIDMIRLALAVILLAVTSTAVTEEAEITIAVDNVVEGVSSVSDPSQTYTLFLPPGFTSDRRWPVLLVFDPRGRSVIAAELFLEAARQYGWIIVSSNDTRSDGDWETNVKAVNALWPEVHNRIPGDPKRIYSAGFSGGATVALSLAKHSGEIAGVIACGGPFVIDQTEGMHAPVFATAGDLDFNYQDLHKLDSFLADQGNPHRSVIFKGAHSWMTQEVATQALEWLELLAMRQGLRDSDAEMVNRLYAKDLATADDLVREGRQLEAAQHLRAVAETFDGLHDVSSARTRSEALFAGPEVRRQIKEAKRWKAFESRSIERLAQHVALLRSLDLPPPSDLLSRDLRITELLKRSKRPGAEGDAVQRVLNLFYTQFGFYMARDFLSAEQYDRAAISLELALKIRSDNPIAWYNLACSRARTHRSTAAIEALEQAVDRGLNRPDLLNNDTDLDALRDRADFKAILEASNTS